ncbi:flagellar hook-length control protein FliK, partial [Campylobacterota bacterium]
LANLLGLKPELKDDKFSMLLKSFSFGKTDEKGLLKALENTKDLPKGLDTFLHGDIAKSEKGTLKSPLSQLFNLGKTGEQDEELIHSDILKALPLKDFKQNLQQLIGEAKNYLKEQISQKADIKELPKSLGGLIKLAEKSGIDVRAINFESLTPTAVKEELSQALNLTRPIQQLQAQLPHSTIQLVKPVIDNKSDKGNAITKPLNALLSKTNEVVSTDGIVDVMLDDSPKTSKTPLSATLSSLLHGEEAQSGDKTIEGESSLKVEGDKGNEKAQSVLGKNDQLSQKITEAKQLVQHVAQSMKEMVENYKPPFTRIKMQLNPHKFGEMDVTLVQRGNNVHININANANALTTMMQNSHELKAQLSAQGLGDASMNFSSHQQQQQQQDKHKQEQAHLSYEEFQEFEEEFTEVATAAEIVVPLYT